MGDHEDRKTEFHDGTWRYGKGATAFAPLNRSGRFPACRAADVRERFAALLSSNGVVPLQQNLFL